MGVMMEPVTMVAMGALSGGFLFGMWYVLVRSDAKLNMRPGMSAEGLDRILERQVSEDETRN